MQQFKRIGRAAILAVVVSAGLAALPAAAERHRHGERGDGFMRHLAEAKAQLNLSASQQVMWDAAVVAGKSAREAARARRAALRQVVSEEAAKPIPSLVKIAVATDQAHDSATTDRRAVRDQWLTLYTTFEAEQIAVVKELLTKRAARADQFRERMERRFGKH